MKRFCIYFAALSIAMQAFPVLSFAYDAYDTEFTKPDYIANLRIQAEKGDPEAQYDLAEAYLKGEGVVQSEKEAAKWYYRSAMQDYPDAQIAMGFVYRGGGGIPMDKVQSYMWLDLATKNGDDRALWMRNELAWSMTLHEIEEARKKSDEWKPQPPPKQYGESE